jgi:glucokinase
MLGERDQILLGDIGGTNARFALVVDGSMGPIETLLVKDYSCFVDALSTFLSRHRERRAFTHAILAVAGPIEGRCCSLTNSSWVIDPAELRKKFNCATIRMVNDFEAIAWSLPMFASSDLLAIGNGKVVPAAPMAVLGPGTGLGLACHAPQPGGAFVIATEGGHVTLPGTCRRDDAIIERLRERFGHVSVERVLSGAGLVNIYQAIRSVDRLPPVEKSAVEITRGAIDGDCPICRNALDFFCGMLGTVAGNVALTFSARGGVFIAGGIAPRILDFLKNSQFRERFESKGRFQSYLANIPTSVIVHREPAFVGLQRLAEQTFNR